MCGSFLKYAHLLEKKIIFTINEMYNYNHLSSLINQFYKNQDMDVLKIFDAALEEIEKDINLSNNCLSEEYKKGMQWTLHSYKLRLKIIRDSVKDQNKRDKILKQAEIILIIYN